MAQNQPQILVKLLFLSCPALRQIRMCSFLLHVSVSVGPLGLDSYSRLLEMVRELRSHRAARSVRGCCAPPARYRLKWELGSDEAARSENLSLPLKHPSPLTLKAEVFQVIFFFFKLFVFSCSFWRPAQ